MVSSNNPPGECSISSTKSNLSPFNVPHNSQGEAVELRDNSESAASSDRLKNNLSSCPSTPSGIPFNEKNRSTVGSDAHQDTGITDKQSFNKFRIRSLLPRSEKRSAVVVLKNKGSY